MCVWEYNFDWWTKSIEFNWSRETAEAHTQPDQLPV